ncbi:hypothetical protein AVEN_10270-1 [Araneus ventricosus]|uniref:Uncharacterized protein n=1 Tax=Araneus ventricosus TaxID=182803 RepID=A0A4Y2KUA4_ARAVE|nr:hypothetical protein AVEN_10270-1 [Araneus ventricosus]
MRERSYRSSSKIEISSSVFQPFHYCQLSQEVYSGWDQASYIRNFLKFYAPIFLNNLLNNGNFFSTDRGCNPDSNFSFQQSCSANLQASDKIDTARVQACNKFGRSERKRDSHHASNFSQACGVKLIAKIDYEDSLRLELATYRFLNLSL